MQAMLARGADMPKSAAVAVRTPHSVTDYFQQPTGLPFLIWIGILTIFMVGLITAFCWIKRAMCYICTCQGCRNAAQVVDFIDCNDVPVHLTYDCKNLFASQKRPGETIYGNAVHSLRICKICLQKELKQKTSSRHQLPADEIDKMFISTSALKKLKQT